MVGSHRCYQHRLHPFPHPPWQQEEKSLGFCPLVAVSFPPASPQRVPAASAWPGVGLRQHKTSHAWDSGEGREDLETGKGYASLVSKPFSSPPQKSHSPLPALLSQQLPKPPGISPPTLATDTRFPCSSPLSHPNFSPARLFENRASPSQTPHPTHPLPFSSCHQRQS